MLFNSFAFIFFFLPLAVVGFFLCGRLSHRLGTWWLVAASLFFYGWWDYHYEPLLLASMGWNYAVGSQLERLAAAHPIAKGGQVDMRWPGARARKAWLAAGIIVNVALLGYFKYTDFFLSTVNTVAGAGFDLPHIVLPLGISFFTFTQTAYLVDAYRGQARNESLATWCEFVTIFPHLIAGPIINHRQMLPQFLAEATFHVNWQNMAAGLTLFVMGLFKKVVLADTLSPWVNELFARADLLTCTEAWLGVLGYTLQLYFDFSGYSEMALGLGLMLNLKLPQNFDSPYQAHSIIDFWRRWHMTLGLWVKDYLYIPLGGNRHGQLRKMRNLFVSMLIIGLWHGAGWTYVLWGAWHGLMLMLNHWWRGLNVRLPEAVCWLLTLSGVVLGWVFFRAADFGAALSVMRAMSDVTALALPADMTQLLWLVVLGAAVLWAPNPVRIMPRFRCSWPWLIVTLALGLAALSRFSQVTDFLYFQF